MDEKGPAENTEIHWLTLTEALSDPYYYGPVRSLRLKLAAQTDLAEIREHGGPEQRTAAAGAIEAIGAERMAALERNKAINKLGDENVRHLAQNNMGLVEEEYKVYWSNGQTTHETETSINPNSILFGLRQAVVSMSVERKAHLERAKQLARLRGLWQESVRPAMEQRIAGVPVKPVLGISGGQSGDLTWLAFANRSDRPLHNLVIRAVCDLNPGTTATRLWYVPSLPVGHTIFPDPIYVMYDPLEKSEPKHSDFELEYFCDEGRMTLRPLKLEDGAAVRAALVQTLLHPGAKFTTKDGDTMILDNISDNGKAKTLNATYVRHDTPQSPHSLQGTWEDPRWDEEEGVSGVMVLLRETVANDKSGKTEEVHRITLRLFNGNCYANYSLLSPVLAEPPQMTPIELAVGEAKRAAVARYPELAVAGSKLNTDYLSRVKRYKEQRPDYFQDASWPLHLADEVAKDSDK